ncbi:hypothetical protein, partial [Escherichia coli]
TNNCISNENHVRLAVGRNFSDCSPVKGVYKGSAGHRLEVSVSVGHEDGQVHEEKDIFTSSVNPAPAQSMPRNSYARYMEMIQQQQQQQQQ